MSVFGKLFKPPLKDWEREYSQTGTAPKARQTSGQMVMEPRT